MHGCEFYIRGSFYWGGDFSYRRIDFEILYIFFGGT